MKTFMFPGQGSQARGMGGSLFDEFSDLTEKADRILGYSIKDLCLEDPRRELNKTQFTQPALYVVNALSYYKKLKADANKPDFLAGHSLGEFNALLAADCFDFEAGLKIVKKRGEIMAQAPSGGMAAILNASREQILEILEQNNLANIDLANYNTPSQIVISGPVDEIALAQQFFQQGEMLYYPLNTSGAFHSRFMQSSKEKFEVYLKKFKFSEPSIPVISNVTAKPYEAGEIVKNISSQLASTVNWSESIQYLMHLALVGKEPMDLIEIGFGDVLTKIAHTIKSQTPEVTSSDVSDLITINSSLVKPEKPLPTVLAEPISKEKTFQKKNENVTTSSSGTSLLSPSANDKVVAWNNRYAVGAKVKSLTMEYDDLETRTEAMVLFGHRAAVYMKSYNGYFDLDELAPV